MGNIAKIAHYSWKPGQSGNPAGRPKGARHKIEERFIADMYEAWKEHGPSIIARVIERKPECVLSVVANLMPKKVDPEGITDLSRADLRTAITALQSLAASGVIGTGTEAGESGETVGLPTVPEAG